MIETALDIDVDADLGFLSALVSRIHERFTAADLGELKEAVAAVLERREDPFLYLAVVGEFSSGKTSFANVLMGEPLLETAALANTAAVTAIRRGASRTLSVRFHGESTDFAFPSRTLERRLALYNRRHDSLEQVLRVVTSDEDVAPTVDRVSLTHPSALLGANIVVLDTPGINSADSTHTATAVAAIAHKADAFIVLLPSTSQLTMTLQAFLVDHLAPYLHRTTFLVTRMEHVEGEEREPVLRFVQAQLREQVGIETPSVLAASLGAAMRARVAGPSATDEDAQWLDAFNTVRRTLVERLRRERAATVAERLIVLLHEALKLSQQTLGQVALELDARAEMLASTAPQDLDAFCAREDRRLGNAIEEAVAAGRRAINAAIDRREREALRDVNTALDSHANASGLNGVLDRVPDIVQRRIDQARPELGMASAAISAAVRTQEGEFDGRIRTQFEGIERLARKRFQPAKDKLPAAAADMGDLSGDARALKARLDKQERWSVAGGAGVGALIGTVIAPGIGTLVGAGIGGIFGREGDIGERRAGYRKQLEPEIQAAFSRLRTRYDEALDRQGAGARLHVAAYIERYRAGYSTAIAELQRAHAAARRELQRQRRQVEHDAAEVEVRTAQLRDRGPCPGGARADTKIDRHGALLD